MCLIVQLLYYGRLIIKLIISEFLYKNLGVFKYQYFIGLCILILYVILIFWRYKNFKEF